ncbi:MAG: ATP-binding cassette domain-containing protein [Fidelibacterota bacterium]|nr:MAG: ATP-binding cassette domain-containing protein [Candidatus Neomarinimicrobiota bacterium]
MVASCFLWDLPPGLYHLYPDNIDLAQRLRVTLEHHERSCFIFPFNMACYLVADTVRREIAFDLENQGLTNGQLNLEVDQIIQQGPFSERMDQVPTTLSGGEQQQLAITAALQQPSEFLIGQHCFDFLSSRNIQRIHDLLKTHGKRMLEISYRHRGPGLGQHTWRLNEERLISLPSVRLDVEAPDWAEAIKPWRLVAQEVVKQFCDTDFTLRIPQLILNQVRCLGITGDNGSGKSTLADCLAKLSPYDGLLKVELPGVDIPCLGYLVQQTEASTQGLNTGDIIQRFANQGRLTDGQAEYLKNILPELRSYQTLAELDASIGYRLLTIAALLSGKYDLVILDEPTYGLPIQGVAEFLTQLTGDLEAKPLVIITHDRNFLTLFCDTIIHLDNGNIHEATNGSHIHHK